MAPKKKHRVPARRPSEVSVDREGGGGVTPTSTPDGPPVNPLGDPAYSDGWTDEQETTLFKAIAIYRWKPAGIHKHFRMLAIGNMMRNHGCWGEHTDTKGIWKKLETLYNLEGLDKLEDMEDDPDAQIWKDFHLPEDEFGELMNQRRLNPEGTASPSGEGRKKRKLSANAGQSRGENVDKLDLARKGSDEESHRSSPVSQRNAPKGRKGTARAKRKISQRSARGGARWSSKKDQEESEKEEGGGEEDDENDDDDDDETTVETEKEDSGQETAESPDVSTPKARRGKTTTTPKSGRGVRKKQDTDVRRSTRRR